MFPQAVFAPVGRVSGPLVSLSKNRAEDVFLFDLETLTSNVLSQMEHSFADYVRGFLDQHDCYLLTRNSYSDACTRLPRSVLTRFKGVFASCGTEYWSEDHATVRHDHEFSDELYEFVVNVIRKSAFYERTPPVIDQGAACLRICLAGIRCSASSLRMYERWEQINKELPDIVNEFRARFPDHKIYQDTPTSLLILPESYSTTSIREFVEKQHKGSRMIGYVHKDSADGYARALCKTKTTDVISRIGGPSDVSQLLSYEIRRMNGQEQMIQLSVPERVEA